MESDGHFGDFKYVGNGIKELRINYAKGYRVYYKEIENGIVILLIGGDKSTQQNDIIKANEIWKRIKRIDMMTSQLDIADYLDSEELIAEYLNTVIEEGEIKDLVVALGHVAKAIGMTKIAEKTGMSRPSLYKALSDGSKPQFETIMKVLEAIGGQINVKPISA